MTGILGNVLVGFVYGEVNPHVSTELNDLTPAEYAPTAYPFFSYSLEMVGDYNDYRQPDLNRRPIVGNEQPNFFRDYYFRVHVDPFELNLQTVASSQTRQLTVWNAWPQTTAALSDILVSNPVGIEISGQATPYTMQPLQELIYEVTIGVSGPPNINVKVQFDFSNVRDPLPILITGTRAVKFDIVPEVPLTEIWEWLSDNIVATDGTEQRIALRGEVPRIESQLKVIFDNAEEIRRFYASVISSAGRLWLPEYQYATRITSASPIGGLVVYFDETQTDIRDGEYVLIQTPLTSSLVEIATVSAGSATLTSQLAFDIPQGSLIMPGSPSLIDNETSIDRYSANTVAETSITARLVRQRSQLARPGSAVVLPTFLGAPVIEKRPLADELVRDAVSTGQLSIDNQTGLPDIVSRWDYSRIGGPRSFKVNRMIAPEEMDYWKTVFAYMRGQARKVWMPTYRTDLNLAIAPQDGATNYTVEGTEYAEKIWPIATHRYVEIETAGGIHRTEISGVGVIGGLSNILFATALPTGAKWQDVKRISYLLPVRLSDDKVEWKHYGLESILNIAIRTAEP